MMIEPCFISLDTLPVINAALSHQNRPLGREVVVQVLVIIVTFSVLRVNTVFTERKHHKVCQMLSWRTKNALYFINICDTDPNVCTIVFSVPGAIL